MFLKGDNMKLQELSYDEVSEAIAYDPETGVFIWKMDVSRNIKKGTAAGTIKSTRHRSTGQTKSYLYIRYKDREMVASRVAWMLHYGVWPDKSVMFKDGDTANLKISNLRLSNSTTRTIGPDGRVINRTTREKQRHYSLKRYYGMSLNDYAEMYRVQDGKCGICKLPETDKDRHGNVRVLAVDHCHKTGSVRELLCYSCNSMLGQAKDNEQVLLAGADYIRRHSAGKSI
jgi:Recombination endonuclease VII/HNH endonuclease